MDFLKEAKKAHWACGRKTNKAFQTRVRKLLLEKLAKVGEITEEDRAWVERQCAEMSQWKSGQ